MNKILQLITYLLLRVPATQQTFSFDPQKRTSLEQNGSLYTISKWRLRIRHPLKKF